MNARRTDVFASFVEVRYRLIGLIVRYQGWLKAMTEPAAGSS
jgi:hypothetical protein